MVGNYINYYKESMSALETISGLLRDFGTGTERIIGEAAYYVGAAAKEAFAILVRQQIVIGVQHLVLTIAFGFALGLVYRTYLKVSKNKEIHEFDRYLLLGLLLFGGIYLATRGIENFNIALSYLANPKYHALVEATKIVEQIKR